MEVRQLSALVAIADHGTFSAAARALYTVQSNVSSHVARLERELDTTLVDRTQGGLTEDGQRVVERARRILHEIDEITSDVARVDGQVVGDVRVGILGTTARWLLPRLLTALDARHPNVRAIVSEGSTSVLIPSLLAGRFSAAIIHLPVDDPELVIEPLFAEDLVLVAHADHPLAASTELPLAEVATHRLLLPPAGSALRRVLDRAAGAVGVQLRAQAEIDGVRLLASLASDGHGAAIVPATAVPRDAAGRVAVIRVPELPPRVVALAHQRRPAPSAPTRALFDVLRGVLREPGHEQPGIRTGTEAFPLSRAV
jgi:molybdate transport repressor ModE-like protein